MPWEPSVVSQLLGWVAVGMLIYLAARLVCWLTGGEW